MASTLLWLVRHATHTRVASVLCGRMADVGLDEAGHAQAARLADRLMRESPRALYASPQRRACETAEGVALRCGLPAAVAPDIDEIDFGDWTGLTFATLHDDPLWQRWNDARATVRPPRGESMAEAQDRVLRWAWCLRARHPGGTVVAVSHADVIKAALAGILGLSLDCHARFEIAPASISAVALWEGGAKVLQVNETVA